MRGGNKHIDRSPRSVDNTVFDREVLYDERVRRDVLAVTLSGMRCHVRDGGLVLDSRGGW